MSAPESAYIPRTAERRILAQVDIVRQDRASSAVLLYGEGGVGKTRMLRALADRHRIDPRVRWVQPLDVDDSEYWVLENLQRRVADALDPDHRFFGEFLDYLAKAAVTKAAPFSRDAVLGHHERARAAFNQCYRHFVEDNAATVVIPLDTVEVVRNTFFLAQLHRWMRELPATLVILSGRPAADRTDTIKEVFADDKAGLRTTTVTVKGFTDAEARRFLTDSDIWPDLTPALIQALVSLTDGHPLWLELAVDYLRKFDLPPELEEPSTHDKELRDRFRRRLVTPFRSAEFWPEAIKRLAVVRHSVDHGIWQAIMADRALPPEYRGDWDLAWETLRTQPWVRPRANGRDVTLHDALAEELTRQLIPLHDQDESWRTQLWHTAADAFDAAAAEYPTVIGAIDQLLVDDPENNPTALQQVARLDVHKRRMDQLRAARLHYLLLSDIDRGTEEFATQFNAAVARNDLHFMELANHELDRFLGPHTTAGPAFDAISIVVDRCRLWLRHNPERMLALGLNAARYLIQSSQPAPAILLLNSLPASDDHLLAYRLAQEHGNACMRIPGQVTDAGTHFEEALAHAEAMPSPDRERLTAEARKELGYYARNIGLWSQADDHYLHACNAITGIVHPGGDEDDRAELASIRTNWAYLKALQGEYQQAHGLVESALDVRRKLNRPLGMAISLSTAGEVCRYDQQYATAWDHYQRAEVLFVTLRNIPWLGQIYQEQAICLFQAAKNNVELDEQPLERAKDLIERSLTICKERAVRWYPSALNRAGRIFGGEDPDRGLGYLRGAVEQAEKVADGWFLSASLIELLELCYQAWTRTGNSKYRTEISNWQPRVLAAIERYSFADLRPRWDLLTGHLAVHDALDNEDYQTLQRTVPKYATALLELDEHRVGSHGQAALTAEFTRFGELFQKLPADVQRSWYTHLRTAWSSRRAHDPADTLLARLDRLY